MQERLAARFASSDLVSRRHRIGSDSHDEFEDLFARGWTDGLPVVPPTVERVFRMLQGTSLASDVVVANVPPNLAPCTVEKAAINAVMAGCKPEYFPLVIASLRAACTDAFNIHGVLATTYFSGPIIIVNGPIARAIGMNSGINALGQGNRANSTIGRALQLIIRNVGGGRPGEIDRATLGSPGKVGFCFAEREHDSPWEPLHVERGFLATQSTVTLFAGQGPSPVHDEHSRSPESLVDGYAANLAATPHPDVALEFDAMLVIPPDHARIFRDATWSKARIRGELQQRIVRTGRAPCPLAADTSDCRDTLNGAPQGDRLRDDGLLIVHAGGNAGMFTGILTSWANPLSGGSAPVTAEVTL